MSGTKEGLSPKCYTYKHHQVDSADISVYTYNDNNERKGGHKFERKKRGIWEESEGGKEGQKNITMVLI